MGSRSMFKLGSINGTQIWIHYSWVFVLLYVTWAVRSVATDRFPELSSGQHWLVGAVNASIFFGSILYREAARTLVTQRFGIKYPSLTLSIFGGSRDDNDEEYTRPGHEAAVVAGGLLATLSVALLFFILLGRTLRADADSESLATVIFFYAAWINIWFMLFNALPGLPLDGGRLVHSVVWKVTGDFDRGVKLAAAAGVGIFGLLTVFGLFRFASGDSVTGVWLVLIGGFLTFAAWVTFRSQQPGLPTRWNRYGPQGGGWRDGRWGPGGGVQWPNLPGGRSALASGASSAALGSGGFVPLANAVHPTPVQASADDKLQTVMSWIEELPEEQQVVPVFERDGAAAVFVVDDAAKFPQSMPIWGAVRSKLVDRAEAFEDAVSVLHRLQQKEMPFAVVWDGDRTVGVVSQATLRTAISSYSRSDA